MAKYIIELERGETAYKTVNSNGKPMIQLLAPTLYTEPDMEQVNAEKDKIYDEARACGYNEGRARGYQEGLADAWDAARTLWNTPNRKEIFGHTTFNTVLTTLTAQEAIEKIRQYEQEKEELEEPKKEQFVTAEDVMRQYLDTFCKGRICNGCPLNTPDFTCGRGRHFLTTSPVSNEEVRRAYAEVVRKMREG